MQRLVADRDVEVVEPLARLLVGRVARAVGADPLPGVGTLAHRGEQVDLGVQRRVHRLHVVREGLLTGRGVREPRGVGHGQRRLVRARDRVGLRVRPGAVGDGAVAEVVVPGHDRLQAGARPVAVDDGVGGQRRGIGAVPGGGTARDGRVPWGQAPLPARGGEVARVRIGAQGPAELAPGGVLVRVAVGQGLHGHPALGRRGQGGLHGCVGQRVEAELDRGLAPVGVQRGRAVDQLDQVAQHLVLLGLGARRGR